jgi:hypothetical protein
MNNFDIQELKILIKQARNFANNPLVSEDEIKQALVLRILNLLGWNIFDTSEVAPEYKTGNGKVDYALKLNGELRLVIEVKAPRKNLGKKKFHNQLLDYVNLQKVEIAILTNGISWFFYLIVGKKSNYQVEKPANTIR